MPTTIVLLPCAGRAEVQAQPSEQMVLPVLVSGDYEHFEVRQYADEIAVSVDLAQHVFPVAQPSVFTANAPGSESEARHVPASDETRGSGSSFRILRVAAMFVWRLAEWGFVLCTLL